MWSNRKKFRFGVSVKKESKGGTYKRDTDKDFSKLIKSSAMHSRFLHYVRQIQRKHTIAYYDKTDTSHE